MSDEELARKREHRMMVRDERAGYTVKVGGTAGFLVNFVPQT